MQEPKPVSVKMCHLVIDLELMQTPTFLAWLVWLMTWPGDGSPGNLDNEPKGLYFTINTETEIRNLIPKPSMSIKSIECQIWGSGVSCKCERWKVGNSGNIEVEFGCFFKRVVIWWFHSDGFWMTWETGPLYAPWTVRILPPRCCLWIFSDVWVKSSSSMVSDSWKDLNKQITSCR